MITTQFLLFCVLTCLYTSEKKKTRSFPWVQPYWWISFYFERKLRGALELSKETLSCFLITDDRGLNQRSWNSSQAQVGQGSSKCVSRANSICIHGSLWNQICFLTKPHVTCMQINVWETQHSLFHLGTVAPNFPTPSPAWNPESPFFAPKSPL